MTQPLLSIFPNSEDFLALEPEELAGVLREYIPSVMQNDMFTISHVVDQFFPQIGQGYPPPLRAQVTLRFAEALSWLVTQGLVVRDPGQIGGWYRLTRRGEKFATKADLEAFGKGRVLPVELLPPVLRDKVWPLFLRGDHDVAVFQAFKEVEVAVRKTANAKGAGYPDDLVGVALMRKAFHPETGPLTDTGRVAAEREADAGLFAGAIGHAKNPAGHRDVEIPPQEAARLIVFAAHLLEIVRSRA